MLLVKKMAGIEYSISDSRNSFAPIRDTTISRINADMKKNILTLLCYRITMVFLSMIISGHHIGGSTNICGNPHIFVVMSPRDFVGRIVS